LEINKYDWDVMFLRQSIAEAKLEDGRTVEVSLNLGGGNYIGRITDPKTKKSTTYTIDPKDFINEILKCEDGTAEFNLIKKEDKDGQKEGKTS
jgi:hypothetical protein